MRGSVGNSGNQGGKWQHFPPWCFWANSANFSTGRGLCTKQHKQNRLRFVNIVRRVDPKNPLYSWRLVLKCAVQWEIVGIKAENGNIFRLGVSTAYVTL
jgi:hypothetical protein